MSYFSTPYLYQVKKNVELPHPKPNCILQKHRSKFNLYSATKSLSVCPPNPAYNICVFGAGEDRAHDPEWLNRSFVDVRRPGNEDTARIKVHAVEISHCDPANSVRNADGGDPSPCGEQPYGIRHERFHVLP